MRKNTKIILTSLALLASASVLAPSAVVSAADQPATNVAATTATSQNSDLQTITMTITKTCLFNCHFIPPFLLFFSSHRFL